MTQVTDTAPKLYTLLLPTVTMTATDFTLSGHLADLPHPGKG